MDRQTEEFWKKARRRLILWVLLKVAINVTIVLIVRKIRKSLEEDKDNG